MQDNKQDNQNNDSLFTQMFGLESEQPTELEPLKPLAPVQNEPNNQVSNVGENLVVENQLAEHQSLEKPVVSPQTDQAPEEIIELSTRKIPDPEPTEEILEPQQNFNYSNQQNYSNDFSQINNSPNNNINSLNQLNNAQTINQQQIPIQNTSNNSFQNDLNFSYQQPTNLNNSNDYEATNQNNSNGNPALAIVLVIILVVALGFGSIQFLSSMNEEKKDYLEEKNTQSTNTETQQETKEEPEKEKINIIFDETLSFDNGVVDIASEVNQTEPYKPTAETGVINCSTKKSVSVGSDKYNMNMYLQYEEYKLKKVLQITDFTFNTSTSYQLNLQTISQLEDEISGRESIRISHTQDASKNKIVMKTLLNLAYGNKYRDESQSSTLFVSYFEYDDDIKSAMAAIIYNQDYLNQFQCSSVKLSQ